VAHRPPARHAADRSALARAARCRGRTTPHGTRAAISGWQDTKTPHASGDHDS